MKTYNIETIRNIDLDKTSGKDYGYELIHINGEAEKSNLHAEMQVIQRVLDKIEQNDGKLNGTNKNIQYIGLSKLCCPDCSAAIKAVNQVLSEKYGKAVAQFVEENDSDQEHTKDEKSKTIEFASRGNHDIESTWVRPPFLKNKYLEMYNQYKAEFKARIRHQGITETNMYPKDSASEDDKGKKKELTNKNIAANFFLHDCLNQLYSLLMKEEITEIQILEVLDKAKKDKDNSVKVSIPTFEDKNIGKDISSLNLPKDKSAALGYGTDNAFNQYQNFEYCYENEDINKIIENFKANYAENIYFAEVLGDLKNDQNPAHILEQYAKNPQKPLIGIYNINESQHWVTYAMIPSEDNKFKMFYKDSLGWNIDKELENKVMEIFADKITIERIEPNIKQQNDVEQASTSKQVSCGIFALENMQVMAHAISENPANMEEALSDAKYFAPDQSMYKQEISNKRKEYAKLYVSGLKLSIENSNDIPIFQRNAEIVTEITTKNIQKIQDFQASLMNKTDIMVELSNDDEMKLGAYYYRITGLEIIKLLQNVYAAKEGEDYIIDGNAVKIAGKIIEEQSENIAILPEAKSVKQALISALNKDQTIYDSQFAAEIEKSFSLVLPTKGLVMDTFKAVIEGKDNTLQDKGLVGFQERLENLQNMYNRRDMKEGKDGALKEFIKTNEDYLKSIKVVSSNIYDLCVKEREGKKLILRDQAIELCKELFIREEMVPKQILTASKDTEYAAGEITDAETSYSSSDSPNSSPEDSSNLKHTNIKEKLAKNGIVVEDIDTSELPPNREKYTKMLQEKINKNDRER